MFDVLRLACVYLDRWDRCLPQAHPFLFQSITNSKKGQMLNICKIKVTAYPSTFPSSAFEDIFEPKIGVFMYKQILFRFHKSKDHEIVQCNFSALDYGDIVKWIFLHPPWSLLILCITAHDDLSQAILFLLIIIITNFIGKMRWYSLMCSLVKDSNFV